MKRRSSAPYSFVLLALGFGCSTPDTPPANEELTTSTGDPIGDDDDDDGPGDDDDDEETGDDDNACGNGVIDDGEECDGSELGEHQSCEDAGLGSADEAVSCSDDCTWSYAACSSCGDGELTEGEECEPANENNSTVNLAGKSCLDFELDGGQLSCTDGCRFDTTECFTCGDGELDGFEKCDGSELAGTTCQDFASEAGANFTSGDLACSDSCEFDVAACSFCGDALVSGSEACDGSELNGETCASRSFTAGTLACNSDCTAFDESACTTCGDGTVEPGEDCDGTNFNGASCQSEGFSNGGDLGCSSECKLDTSACVGNLCGDGTLDGGSGESCDCGPDNVCTSAELGNKTCSTEGFDGGTLGCNSPTNCGFDTSRCYRCGDGAVNPGETCDGADLGGNTCESLGDYEPGNQLTCDDSCEYDLSGCVPSNIQRLCSGAINRSFTNSWLRLELEMSVPGNPQVTDIDLELDITHPEAGQISAHFTGPGLSTRQVITQIAGGDPQCTASNLKVTLDDSSATGLVNGCTPPTFTEGTYAPNVPILVNTITTDGTYILWVTASEGQGTLNSWCVNVRW